jgi:hypothetical protein
MRLRFLLFIAAVLMSDFTAAQLSTLPAAQAIADLPGPPKNPPIFSEMTAMMQGALDYQRTVDVKGNVSRVEREETQPLAQYPFPMKTAVKPARLLL